MFTHGHDDNILGIKKILKFKDKNSLINCYCDKITYSHLKRIWPEVGLHLEIKEINHGDKVENFIEFLKITHKVQDGYPTYGIVIDKLAFFTPLYSASKKVWDKISNCEWLITSCKYLRKEKYKDNQSLLRLISKLRYSKIKSISLLGVSNFLNKLLPFNTLKSGDIIKSKSKKVILKKEFAHFSKIILKMKLEDINTTSIRKVTDQEVLSLHRRMHQLYSLWIRQGQPKEKINYLFKKHLIIVKEMIRRGWEGCKVNDELGRRTRRVLERQSYPKAKIIDNEFIKIVGSSLWKKDYNDVDIIVNLRKYSKKVDTIIKKNIKSDKRLHILYSKRNPHGYYKPVGKLIVKEGRLSNDEHLIVKKGYVNYAILFHMNKKIRRPKVKPKYFETIEFYKSNTKVKFSNMVIEPYYNNKNVKLIHRKKGKIKYSKGLSVKVVKDIINIQKPKDFILAGIVIGKNFYLLDLLAKNEAWLGNDILVERKSFLSKIDISKCKYIKMFPYKYANKSNFKLIMKKYIAFKNGVLIKDIHSKYNGKFYVIKTIKGRGEGQGQEGPRQGDGGADFCICPKCSTKINHPKGSPCNKIKCPKCGTLMRGTNKKEEVHTKPAPDITENYIRWRLRNPNLFIRGSLRTKILSKEQGIKSIIGRMKKDNKWHFQSILFDKTKWTVSEARKWIKEHKENLKRLFLFPLKKYFTKSIDLPLQEAKSELEDKMIEKILGVDAFGQEKIIKSISPYKIAIYSKALHTFYTTKENKIIDLKWSSQYIPATFELLETKRDERERLLISGYILIKEKQPLVIHFRPGFHCQILTIYCRKEDIKYMEKTFQNLEKYVKDNNYYKNEKITPFGDFLPLTPISKLDVILEEKTMKRLDKTVFNFFNNKKKYEQAEIPFKRGVIFSGLPGTGKTLSGKIIMNNIQNVTFIWVTAKDFRNLSTGYLFEMARELQPSILFIEDVDRVLVGSTLDTIKTQMDGLYPNDGILVILSTNFPNQLPKTLIDRPGRFDDVIEFNLPNIKLRFKILIHYSKKIKIENKEKTLLEIAKISNGLTPAHLKEILVSAYMNSEQEILNFKDLQNSFNRIQRIHERFKNKHYS